MDAVPGRHTKKQKEMARKRTSSGQRKAQETGVLCNIFVAYVFWNPTYKRLQGVMHCPKGMKIPDINGYLQGQINGSRYTTRQRGKMVLRRRQPAKDPESLTSDEITVEDESPNTSIEMSDDSPALSVTFRENELAGRVDDPEDDAISDAADHCRHGELPQGMHDHAPIIGNSADDATLDHSDVFFGESEGGVSVIKEVGGYLPFDDTLCGSALDLETYGNFMVRAEESPARRRARDQAGKIALLLVDFKQALRS